MAQIVERSGMWYARFMHNKKDHFRSTGVAVPTEGKKAIGDSKALAMAGCTLVCGWATLSP